MALRCRTGKCGCSWCRGKSAGSTLMMVSSFDERVDAAADAVLRMCNGRFCRIRLCGANGVFGFLESSLPDGEQAVSTCGIAAAAATEPPQRQKRATIDPLRERGSACSAVNESGHFSPSYCLEARKRAWPIPLNGHHPVSPCAHCPGERGGPARALRFNEKAVMPSRSGVLGGVRGWICKRWLTVFAIPFRAQ